MRIGHLGREGYLARGGNRRLNRSATGRLNRGAPSPNVEASRAAGDACPVRSSITQFSTRPTSTRGVIGRSTSKASRRRRSSIADAVRSLSRLSADRDD